MLTQILGPQRKHPPNPHLPPEVTTILFPAQGRRAPPTQGHTLLDAPGGLQLPPGLLMSFLTLPPAEAGLGDL